MIDRNNAVQAAEQEVNTIMEQAQVFASAWAFFGGPFDQGDGKEQAEREGARLRDVIRAVLSKLHAPVADEQQAMIARVDAAMVEMQHIHPPLGRSECERLIRAALSAQPGAKKGGSDA
ncbi:hypothetical protein [Achromobacter marplatensis]